MVQSNRSYDRPAQWQQYCELELIPLTLPDPATQTPPFTWGLNWLWRGLLHLLIEELVEEQRVEYLDRCWALDISQPPAPSAVQPLQRLWVLME